MLISYAFFLEPSLLQKLLLIFKCFYQNVMIWPFSRWAFQWIKRLRWVMLHAFSLSNSLVSNTRLKFTKSQTRANQHPQAEVWLFENFNPRCHPKIIVHILRYLHIVIRARINGSHFAICKAFTKMSSLHNSLSLRWESCEF